MNESIHEFAHACSTPKTAADGPGAVRSLRGLLAREPRGAAHHGAGRLASGAGGAGSVESQGGSAYSRLHRRRKRNGRGAAHVDVPGSGRRAGESVCRLSSKKG